MEATRHQASGNRHSSTTVNGVVINIAAGGQHQVSHPGLAATPSKASRRVRRDASFRLPAFFGGSKCSVNGSSSPASSRRAPSPSSLSSVSSSSSPAFVPINGHNNNNNNSNNNNLGKGLDVHNHPESARVMHHADYLSSSSSSSSNGDLISNVKIPSEQLSETYKSLGDVFGINAAVASIAASTGNVWKSSAKHSHQPHLKSARSVSNVLGHMDQVQRLSTYANVPQANSRFGSSDMRASYSERLSVSRQPTQMQPQAQRQYNNSSNNPFPTSINGALRKSTPMGPPPPPSTRNIIYKSNTSLDLDHDIGLTNDTIPLPPVQQDAQLRREYGSQGSINVPAGSRFTPSTGTISANGGYGYRERIYANPVADLGQASPGPAAMSTLQRKPLGLANGQTNNTFAPPPSREMNKSEDSTQGSIISNGSSNRDINYGETGSENSPKFGKKKTSTGSGGFFSKERESGKSQKSLFKKLRGSKESNPDPALFGKDGELVIDRQALLDDCHRRRFFLHHDIGSMCARLSGVTNQIKLLERKNTTTGASAASAALRNSSGAGTESPDGKEDSDHGDGISNELVLSCPYFRNEVGGEGDRIVALTKETAAKRFLPGHHMVSMAGASSSDQMTHTPAIARGFSLIDSNETYWKAGYCPYRLKRTGLTSSINVIERVDEGATFYKKCFFGQDHQNWFGNDEYLGPLAISIRREKVPSHPNASDIFLTPRTLDPDKDFREQFMYRLMIRTSDLVPLRGCVLEESIPSLRSEKVKSIPTKEVLEFVCPEIQLSSLHLGIQSGPCEEQLIRLDEAYVQNKYKVGLMYCREGQQTEEEMYNNEEGGPAFNEFLDLIGQKIRLKGFNKYKAGLCSKNDSTGLFSVYTEHEGNEIMFHVSTLLPYTPNNRQQLPRKRYIGNDIVTVVFQEPGARPFIPNIKSQFQHVFIVVRVYNPCSENTQYSVAVSRSKSVPMFGPNIPHEAKFPKSKSFSDFLLTKIINAENAAHRSDKFVSMALRTRQELLKDLATNYVTQTTMDSGSKFNLFSTKKKDKVRPRFSPDTSGLRGAISWRVVAEDCSTRHEVDAFLGISPDSIVLVQDNLPRDILFLTATKSVIGWTALQNSIRIFFHQGEALILHSKDWETDDMSEISQRLKSVTNGAPTQEFTLRRNQLGQLGFHVQHDGLITEVENFGYAWQTGLRQGSRLVEIIKTPVNALSHQQMVELLKASMTVTVTVIPPHPDGSPRQGCNFQNCSNMTDDAGDYENITSTTETRVTVGHKPVEQQQTQRSFSPPRSSNSSGYGTGSSRKSLGDPLLNQPKAYYPGQTVIYDGGIPSLSSGQSSDEQKWYDEHPISSSENSSPPPLPNRIGSGKNSAFQRVSATGTSGNAAECESPIFATNSSSANSSPSIYQHPPPPRMKVNDFDHSKVTPATRFNGYESPSSNTPHLAVYSKGNNGSRPFSNSPKNHSDYPEEKRSIDARVTYLTEYELIHGKPGDLDQVTPNSRLGPSEYLQHERLTALKTASLPPSKNSGFESTPNHSSADAEQHQRMQTVSEDELSGTSAGSDSASPVQHRQVRIRGQTDSMNVTSLGPMAPASGSVSRDQSPRNFLDPTAKVKRQVARHHPNRNSANLASSTLQEDLLKLIGPDFETTAARPVTRQNSKSPASDYSSVSVLSNNVRTISSNQRKMSLTNDLHLMRSRSRENIAGVAGGGRLSTTLVLPSEEGREFHMARPATVISNTSATSSPSDPKNLSNLSSTSRKDISVISSTPSPSKKVSNSQTIVVTSPTSSGRSSSVQAQPHLPLPDAHQMDWLSLVDTATKAISVTSGEDLMSDLKDDEIEVNGGAKANYLSNNKSAKSKVSTRDLDSVSHSSHSSRDKDVDPQDVHELLEKVSLLENRLTSEAREKSHLAEEVSALREENLRLQEESQIAAQQLKKFTDWFFQAIDNA